jgi:hypothetical protein
MSYYWFKPRRYGIGAAPATWEGWALTLAVIVIVAGSIVAMNLLVDRSNFVAWMAWAAIIAGVTFWFVRTARERTDGEWRWRWGADKKQ